MSSDLDHWNINATVFKDRVEEIHFVNDPAKNIRRQQQKHTWHVGDFLGRGGFGEVRLQQNHKTGKARAVKRITMTGNIPSKSECEKELEALLEFSKPKFKEAACFVEFYGWFRDGHEMFLAMEFVELGDLEKNVIAYSGKIPESEARDIAGQILSGLEIMHAVKFAHRDLKPQNVMVVSGPPHWWVKLADFGLSKRLTETTRYHTRSGTQSYMAPEMLNYLKTDTPDYDYTDAVDIWATGCIVYRLVTGAVPFPPGTFLMKYCEDKSLFPYDQLFDSGVKSGLVRFLRELLAVTPGERLSASQALQHVWIKTALNIEKQPSAILRTSEAAAASLSELTISDIAYNTVSHYGLKSEPEAPPRPNSHHTQFPSGSPSYNVDVTDLPSQATVVQGPLFSEKMQRKPVATQLSSRKNHTLFDSKEPEDEINGYSERVLGREMSNTKSAKTPAMNQKEKPNPKRKIWGALLNKLTGLDRELVEASEMEGITRVEELLNKGANVGATNKDGWTPLHHASDRGQQDTVQLLLDKGANTEATNTYGWTPLHCATFEGHQAIVQLLLNNGANIEAADKDGWRPLRMAELRGWEAVIKQLLESGADASHLKKRDK